MKKNVMMASSALALVMSVSVFAGGPDEGESSLVVGSSGTWYAGVVGGVSMLGGDLAKDSSFTPTVTTTFSDVTSTGYDLGFTLGYALNTHFSAEGQALFVENSGKDGATGKASEWVFMGNVKYAFAMGNAITPYVGAGFGYMSPDDYDDTDGFTHDGKVAYQAIVGIDYALNPYMDLLLDYHFVGPIGSQDVDGETTVYLPLMHLINIGFNYKF